MPWIIGEAGFRANEGSYFGLPLGESFYDGTLSDQKNFADSVAGKTWECGGSGFSWWAYQDVNLSDGFGILKNSKACGTWPCDSILKPVWEVFEEFSTPTSGGCSEPPYYKDPFYHEVYSPNTNIVTGTVLGQDSLPIKDAVVFAHTRLYNPEEGQPEYYPHYTFTDENGFFSVIPYDYSEKLPDWNVIECITISAPVCSRIRKAAWDSIGVDSGQTYYLDKFDLNNYESFESLTVTGSEPIILQAWDSVSLTDVEVQQHATCEALARTEIVVNKEFIAADSSEVWIHINTPSIPCDSLGFFSDRDFIFVPINEIPNGILEKKLLLHFIPTQGSFDVLIYPNPGVGLFAIEVECSTPLGNLTLSIYDSFGKIVYSSIIRDKKSKIDLSHFAKGFYIIQISNIDYQIIKKIIIQ